jgi:hypothetical protein
MMTLLELRVAHEQGWRGGGRGSCSTRGWDRDAWPG